MQYLQVKAGKSYFGPLFVEDSVHSWLTLRQDRMEQGHLRRETVHGKEGRRQQQQEEASFP